MRPRIAFAIKLLGGFLLHSAHHAEDYTPVLYTEKRMVRVISHPGCRSVTYAVPRGEKLHFAVRDALHHMRHCWQRHIMRLSFSF